MGTSNPSADDMDGAQGESGESPRFAIEPHVDFSRRDAGGRTAYVVHHRVTGKYFRFGVEEYRVVNLLDGTRTLVEIATVLEQDGIKWSASELAEFISQLVAARLASPVVETATAANMTAEHSTEPSLGKPAPSPIPSWSHRALQLLSLTISQRFPLLQGNKLATRLERRFGWAISLSGMLAWGLLVCSGLVIVAANRQQFYGELRRMFDSSIWLMLLVMWILSKVLHEAGHAIAARHHGVRVGKIGIMFFFMAPLAYVDVTDAWKLRSRWSRMQIAMAGVYFELGLAAIAAWFWWMLPDSLTRHLAAQLFFVAGPATLLVNANPLLRLDGYYVLSDLTEIPNLRMHGRRQLKAWLERWLLNISPRRSLLEGWRRAFATVHAACSVMFQVVWMTGLIIGVTIWAKGLGIVMAVSAALLWGVIPLARWSYKIWIMDPPGRWFLNEKRERLIGMASILMLVATYLCSHSSPFARRIPVVVQFHDQQVARASADAFVQAVYVSRGQRVKAGRLLLVLEDVELELRREQMADEFEIAKLRAVQLRRKGDLSQAASEEEKSQSLQRQLVELDAQLEGLEVIAKRDGWVLGSSIDELEGSFVNRGDELLRVSDPQEKELLASVGGKDMRAYQAAAARAIPANVRLRGGSKIKAVPAALRPRARHQLPHPALAATAGGPLPVEPSPDQEGQLRVIEPQLQSMTRLDPVTSTELRAGQIGTMTIADDRSLAIRVWDSVTPQ